jgi:hypothetical protein
MSVSEIELELSIRLVLADMLRANPLWRTMEVLREVLHRVNVATSSTQRVVATLKFIQHPLTKLGHGNLL